MSAIHADRIAPRILEDEVLRARESTVCLKIHIVVGLAPKPYRERGGPKSPTAVGVERSSIPTSRHLDQRKCRVMIFFVQSATSDTDT
ncbi:MAG TPA: hypothetical protein VIU64_18550, partial [Polyangia bacterium]